MSLVALDLDGTLIENKWPALGDWKHGAVGFVQALLDNGHTVYVYTARLYHLWPNGDPRTPGQITDECRRVRALLDDAGLFDVGIKAKEPYDLLIDDRVLRFQGWDKALYETAVILRDGELLDAAWDASTAAER